MKTKDLTLPELKAGELPKPEEKVKVDWDKWAEQEALLETEPEPVDETPIPEETAYHIPDHYKDLGDLTQEEWQEVFGRPDPNIKLKMRKNNV